MNTTRTFRRRAGAAAGAAALLLLAACGEATSSGPDETTAPTAEAETAAEGVEGAWTAEDEAGYQADYEQASQHLLDSYGILDSAELCDELDAVHADPESFDAFAENFSTEAGVDYDPEMHPADSGAIAALWDWCDANA